MVSNPSFNQSIAEAKGPCVDYVLRAATQDDEDFLYQLHVATMKATVSHVWGWDDEFQAAYFREHFEPSRLHVIVGNNSDAGVLALEHRADVVFLASIEITPHFQGRGLGTRIIQDVIAAAHQRGIPVALQVIRVNPARRLYERLGFVKTGQTDTHDQMVAAPGSKISES